MAEMSATKWKRAWDILKEMGITFNLILGNEPWVMGRNLIKIMENNEIPFAMYTSCNPVLYASFHKEFFDSFLDNFSCAVDYSKEALQAIPTSHMNDMEKKAENAWRLLRSVKEDHPTVDCQGQITIHAKNVYQVPYIVRDLSAMNVFVGVNLIHAATDEQTDFAPPAEEISDLLFGKGDEIILREVFDEVKATPGNLVMNCDYLDYDTKMLIGKNFHCQGNPYGGPTIDADGSLRCCGYRKGRFTSKMNIFDLPKGIDDWKENLYYDAMECKGCSWGYMLLYHKLLEDPEWGKKVLINHAIKTVEESKWSKRKIE
jgi:hypothetical protein